MIFLTELRCHKKRRGESYSSYGDEGVRKEGKGGKQNKTKRQKGHFTWKLEFEHFLSGSKVSFLFLVYVLRNVSDFTSKLAYYVGKYPSEVKFALPLKMLKFSHTIVPTVIAVIIAS